MTIEEIIKCIEFGTKEDEDGNYWYFDNHDEILKTIKKPEDILLIMKAMKRFADATDRHESWHSDLDELLCKYIEITTNDKELIDLYNSFGKWYD